LIGHLLALEGCVGAIAEYDANKPCGNRLGAAVISQPKVKNVQTFRICTLCASLACSALPQLTLGALSTVSMALAFATPVAAQAVGGPGAPASEEGAAAEERPVAQSAVTARPIHPAAVAAAA
jgi:hypothetical protein